MQEQVIPILRVQDAESAVVWYQRLGFRQTSVHRFGPHFPAFVTIERGPMKIFLSEHKGDARPDTLLYLAVADVYPIAKEFGVPVEEAPWVLKLNCAIPMRTVSESGCQRAGNNRACRKPQESISSDHRTESR
jgi:Glyoxalase superfamily protein